METGHQQCACKRKTGHIPEGKRDSSKAKRKGDTQRHKEKVFYLGIVEQLLKDKEVAEIEEESHILIWPPSVFHELLNEGDDPGVDGEGIRPVATHLGGRNTSAAAEKASCLLFVS